MAGAGFSLQELQSWNKDGRKKTTTENILNAIQSGLAQMQVNKQQGLQDISNESLLREKGYVRPEGQSQNGIVNMLKQFAGTPQYQYDPTQDLTRQKVQSDMQKNALDQYYKQAQTQKALQDVQKSKYEMTPESRAAKSRESVGRQNAKDKKTAELFDTFETNAQKKNQIEQAREAAKNITGGIFGQLERSFLGKFQPNAKQLGEWQKIKMVLTDAQLMNTAKTKGAISNQEMELFAQAAANDDLASIQKMMPVFDKLIATLQADEQSKVKAYKRSYGEDPLEWEEMQAYKNPQMANSNMQGDLQEGQTATNPQTGEKIIFRGGQWQKIQ